MRYATALVLATLAALKLTAGSWPAIPKEVWSMRDNPALVAQGAVILERKLDFQPLALEESLRIRILSPAGVRAAEITNMSADVSFLEGRVTFPDGRVQPITKREDFLLKEKLVTTEGTRKEGVLIPSGVTSDCVVEVRWFEKTERGRLKLLGESVRFATCLPPRMGGFARFDLASPFPVLSFVIQNSRENFLTMQLFHLDGFAVTKAESGTGNTYTLHDLPAFPEIPYSLEMARPSPKMAIYSAMQRFGHPDPHAAPGIYWQRTVDDWFREYFIRLVSKGSGYRTFSEEVRKDLAGDAKEQALLIGQRIAKRIANLDRLQFDEKPPFRARDRAESSSGVADLDFAAESGFTDNFGLDRLYFHILTDAGLAPKIALVSDRNFWFFSPEIQTTWQIGQFLIGVEQPGKGILWMDPHRRLLPPGELEAAYQGTHAMIIDSATWKIAPGEMGFRDVSADSRTFTYLIDAAEEGAKVQIEAAYLGAPALAAREILAVQAPIAREAWFKAELGKGGLTLARVATAEVTDSSKPLGITAEGSMPLEAGRLLKFNPFPGMGTRLYLPDSLPETRQDPIFMFARGVDEAHSTVHVPKGYLLHAPIRFSHSNRWGQVNLQARQDPATGDLQVAMKIRTTGFMARPDGYQDLKDYLQWVTFAAFPEITLERAEDGK